MGKDKETTSSISRPIISGNVLERELQFTLTAITKVSRNESAWNYLRGLINHCSEYEADQLKSKIYVFCVEMQKEGNTSPYLLSTIMDLDKDEAKLKNAIQLCNSLANDHDVIRKEYWNYIAK